MKASIKNSKGVERDTTMQLVYTSAGATFGTIADLVSKNNTFDFTRFNNGSSSTSNAESGKAVITYTKQNMTAVYNKFNHEITVTNGAAYIMLAGQKLEFLPTQIAVENPSKDQVTSPTTSGNYNVWAIATVSTITLITAQLTLMLRLKNLLSRLSLMLTKSQAAQSR